MSSNDRPADVWVLQDSEPAMELFDMSSRSSDIGTSVRSRSDGGGSQRTMPTPRDFSPRNNHSYPLLPNCGDSGPSSPQRAPSEGQLTTLHELTEPFMAILRLGGLYFELEEMVSKNKNTREKSPPAETHSTSNGPLSNHTSAAATTIPLVTPRRPPRGRWSRILCCARGGEPSESLSFSLCSLSLIVAIIDDVRLIYAFYACWYAQTLSSLAMVVDSLVTIAWTLQCLVVHCILMVMCYQNRFAELFDAWEELRLTYPDSLKTARAFNFIGKFRHKQKLLIVGGFAALLLNCYSLIGPLVLPLTDYKDFREYVMAPFEVDNYMIMMLIIVAFIFRSFDYVFTATLFLLLSDAIVLQFSLFYQDLSCQISKDGVLADAGQLEWHRLKHTKLCALVRRVDAIFSPYVLIGLASGMFGILAQVYVIYDFLKQPNGFKLVTVLSYIYWSLLNLAQVLVILWCGSKVHVANMSKQEITKLNGSLYTDQALLPLSKLYEIDQRTLSVQETQHLTVFLQKLSNCQTGYTALGIFTIDMTTILSLAGFYFTYQILLFQMRNDSSLDEKLKNHSVPVQLQTAMWEFLNKTIPSCALDFNASIEAFTAAAAANTSNVV